MKTIEHLLVVGVGLIGGSFALALKAQGMVNQVTGFGRSAERLAKAVELGVIDHGTQDLANAASQADLVFLACPVDAMQSVFSEIRNTVQPGCIITDGGSTKLSVIRAARAGLQDKFSQFVPGHPVAGSEKSGVTAAFPTLYQDHRILLTPVGDTDGEAVETVSGLWHGMGGRVTVMDPVEHDRILGLTSHLPHVLAYVLVEFMARLPDSNACFDLAAGGFLDFTRIAASDPVMWRDITLANREEVLKGMDDYIQALQQFRGLVECQDGEAIQRIYQDARCARNQLIDRRGGRH